MRILVTGASGYIGHQLADKLSVAGHDVTCMVRNAARSPQLHSSQIKFVEADALQAKTLSAALKGIDVPTTLFTRCPGGLKALNRVTGRPLTTSLQRRSSAACNV